MQFRLKGRVQLQPALTIMGQLPTRAIIERLEDGGLAMQGGSDAFCGLGCATETLSSMLQTRLTVWLLVQQFWLEEQKPCQKDEQSFDNLLRFQPNQSDACGSEASTKSSGDEPHWWQWLWQYFE